MIDEKEFAKLKETLTTLQKQNRRLTWKFYALLALLAVIVPMVLMAERTSAVPPPVPPDSVLRVRGLIVTDANGKERVHIGSPLPDPMLQGKRYRRNGAISGILLMDSDGTERSGYFTSDSPGSVALTLDTVAGQTAMFLANDENGANIQVHDRDYKHSVGMLAVGDAPSIYVERAGKTIFEIPEKKEEKK